MCSRAEFEDMLDMMKPGHVYVYHEGNLMADRAMLIFDHAKKVDEVARAAWDAMEAGKVHLAQVRMGPARFAYLAVKRAPPFDKITWTGCYDPRPQYKKAA